MPDLIIKPAAQSGNKVIIQDQAGGAVLTTADSGVSQLSTPAGHVIDSGIQLLSGGYYYTNSTTRSVAVAYRPVSVAVGDTIHFGFSGYCRVYYNIAQTVGRHGEVSLYHNTVTAAAGAAPTGTAMSAAYGGRILHSSSGGIGDADNDSYFPFHLSGAFVATATTHHLGLAIKTGHANARIFLYMSSGTEVTFYYYILKGDRII